MGSNVTTRDDDERLLGWLALRDLGWTPYRIAQRCGVRDSQRIYNLLRKVDQDLAASERGERIGYWPFRVGAKPEAAE